jgi:hypothetical protein
MNYLQRTIIALEKAADAEMVMLFRRFSTRLNEMLTPTELDAYARYLLAPAIHAPGAPATFTEEAVRRKVQADPAAAALGKQNVAGLTKRKGGL